LGTGDRTSDRPVHLVDMVDIPRRVSLVEELCRVLHSCERAMLCAMSHEQVRVDGYVVRPKDDQRWTRAQLAGRTAQLESWRTGRLFDDG